MTVGMYAFMAGLGAQAYGNTRTWGWPRQHLPSMAIFLTIVVYGLMLIWHLRYYVKLRRQAEAGTQDSGN
jgi:hypothetical protein